MEPTTDDDRTGGTAEAAAGGGPVFRPGAVAARLRGHAGRLVRAGSALVGLAVFLLAWDRAETGIEWSVGFHPDELPVAAWVAQVLDGGVVRDRAYPGGWFELARLKNWADGRLRRGAVKHARRRAQEGAVTAVAAETFRRTTPSDATVPHDIQWGRDFNELLYALTALLLFLAALEAGAGTAGAAVSAAFFLVLPAPLEHAHYCETDLGVLATLALSFWTLAAAGRRRSLPFWLAAGFAAGFCVSCKYTVAPLAFVPAAVAAAAGARGRRPGRAAAWAALALLAAALGFVAGTPQLYKAPRLLHAAVARGGLRASPDALANLGSLLRQTAKAGALPLLWAAVSVPLWFRRPWRRALAGPALFVALFLPFALFRLPWVRNQETLPILAALSLGAGLPVAAALRATPDGRRRFAAPLAAGAALLAAALVSGFFASERMLASFCVRDTRALARDALAEALPRDASVGLDGYASQAARGVTGSFTAAGRLQESYPGSLDDPRIAAANLRYFLLDASHEGRPGRGRERFSGRPVPAVEAAVGAFRRDAPLLRAWTLPAGSVRPLFAQHDLELRLLPGDGAGRGLADVPIPFARPVLALPFGVPLHGTSGPAWFGPREALRAVGRRSTVDVPRDGVPRWAVVRHAAPAGAPGRVGWKGAFRPVGGTELAPGGAVAAAAPAASPRTLAPDLRQASRVRVRSAGGREEPCLVWLTSDPAEAALALRRAGRPAEGLALLRAAPDALETGTGRVAAFLCAGAAGETPDPAWREAAADAIAALAALRTSLRDGPFPGAATVCGVPFEALRDFARLRAEAVRTAPDPETPIFAPAGDYRLEVAFPPARAPQVVGHVLFEGQAEPFAPVDGVPADAPRAAAPLHLETDCFLRFRADLPPPPPDDVPVFREVGISWDPLEPVEETASEIRALL